MKKKRCRDGVTCVGLCVACTLPYIYLVCVFFLLSESVNIQCREKVNLRAHFCSKPFGAPGVPMFLYIPKDTSQVSEVHC